MTEELKVEKQVKFELTLNEKIGLFLNQLKSVESC
jgi:hypothetical protein